MLDVSAYQVATWTHETKGQHQEAKGKGDSGKEASRKTGQAQANTAFACCLGTLDQPDLRKGNDYEIQIAG